MMMHSVLLPEMTFMTIPTTNDRTRRAFMASGMAALALPFLPGSASALTEDTATALIDKVVSDINRVIASGRSLGAMIKEFENIFRRYADVPIIAQSTLGQDWKRASSGQRKAYVAAFRSYVARKYGKRFKEFEGGNVEVRSVRKVRSGYEVKSFVTLRGRRPFEVAFLVSDRSGRDLFFDMIIEGISLRLTERTEIGSMLDRRKGNIDALIGDLKQSG